jgi:hypothetical protein
MAEINPSESGRRVMIDKLTADMKRDEADRTAILGGWPNG